MREKFSIFLISLAIIGFQLAIINLLSYSQWHHFAYLAVSIAMLGFGSSGVILSVWEKFFRRNAETLMPWLFLFTALLMFFSPIIINSQWFRFDTFLLFTSRVQLLKLFLTCLVLFFPFLTGATALGLFFMVRSNQIPLLYAWNLAGSAAGGVVLVWLSNSILPMHLTALFGFFVIVGSLFLGRFLKYLVVNFLVFLLGAFAIWNQPSVPFTSEFKSLSKTLLIPDTRIERRVPLANGTLEIVSSNNLRQANGLSLSYTGSIPLVDMAFLNAQAYSAFERAGADNDFYELNLFAIPYKLLKENEKRVLLLQPTSTFFASQALSFGAERVKVVEPLGPIADSLSKFPWKANNVVVEKAYPREFLIQNSSDWDIILFPMLGSAGGAGLGALQEQYLITTNAIKKSIELLGDEGFLVLSSYMDNPARSSLKLLSVVAASLNELNLTPTQHLLAARSWNTLLIIVKTIPFTVDELDLVNSISNSLGFDMVHPESVEVFNMLSDSTFQQLANQIIANHSAASFSDYVFNLRPSIDNSPFFSQFMKLSNLTEYLKWYGVEGVPFLELGYFIIWASLVVCLFLALVAIVFPLFLSLKKRRLILWVWIYFSLLGLAYMLLEVSLIQRSILTMGNPITASAVIIGALLCFSAIGSYYSSRFSIRSVLPFVLLGIGFLIILFALIGDGLSNWLVSFNFSYRLIILVLSISPLALLMGMAFPMGMKLLSEHNPDQIPIAWGVNGFFSVLAAPIATIIAVESGFVQVLFLSAIIYLLCILVVFRKA